MLHNPDLSRSARRARLFAIYRTAPPNGDTPARAKQPELSAEVAQALQDAAITSLFAPRTPLMRAQTTD